mmetsp:Transcript_53233/g.95521  ORF Transcript_53233/g.95521 Transcript_53233/m.95521 type:complete len:281 (-) Transcript_53233:94-936(-)
MEPVTILLATGAIAVYAAHRAERATEQARRGPVTLPEMMEAESVDEETPVQVLAVHVQKGFVSRRLFGEKLKVRVKYGDPGVSIHCDTGEVKPLPPPRSPAARYVTRLLRHDPDEKDLMLDFGTSCLFLDQRGSENRIRLRLLKVGLLGRTVAKAELRLPSFAQCGTFQQHHLDLTGSSFDSMGEFLGKLDVALEARVMSKRELRQYMKTLHAEKQHDGFLVDIVPLAEGEVTEVDEEDNAIVQGKFVSSRELASSKLGALCGLCRGRNGQAAPAVVPAS